MENEAFFSGMEWIVAGGYALIMIGIAFLILEFFLPSFGVFGFSGAASILIGVVQLYQAGRIDEMPISPTMLVIFAVIGSILAFIGGLYGYFVNQQKNTTGVEAMVGTTARVLTWKSKTGRVNIHGEDWQAYSDKAITLKQNDIVTVLEINDLKIKITE